MNRQFSQCIATVQNQLHTLLKQVNRLPPDERELAAKALDALSRSIEELHVAEEELQQQNEELSATREAVEAERQRYQDIFSFAPDGYLVTNADGVIQEANRAATRLLGASESHLIGTPLVIFVPGRERTTFYSRINRLREEGGEQREQWEMRLQPRGGDPFPAELTVASVQDREGRVTGLRWLISDITARVEAEEALRATERHYRGLFEEASIGLYRTTPEGEILDANRALAQILGCPDRASLLEANALDFYVDPEDRARHLAQLEEADTATVEFRLRRCDGEIIWMQDTGRVERDDEGRILHGDGAIHDITERKQAAMERERLLHTLDHRATQLQTAAKVSRTTSETLDPEALIHQAVNLIREQFGLYYVGLFLVDRTGEWTGEPDRWAVLRAGTGEAGQRLMERGHKLEIGDSSMVGWCIANEEPRIALDVGEDPVRFDTPELPETHSEMALPLISRGEVLGALTIQSAEERAFADDDIAVLQTMADQLANALENARLYEQAQREIAERKRAEQALQEYAHRQAALYKVTAATASFLSPEEMLSTALKETIAVANADAGWVVLPGEPPCVAASRGVPDSLANAEACRASDYLTRLPALDIAELSTELGTITESPHPVPEEHDDLDLYDTICVPLTAYDQVLGFLHLAQRDPETSIEMDKELLTTIGRQIGVALRNAQLYQQACQVDRLRTVNEITTAVVSSLEMDEVLRQILAMTCHALDATEGSVLLREPDTGELVFAMTLEGDGNDLQGMHLEPGQGVAGWVAEHGQSVYVNDVKQDARFCEAIDAVTGFETRSLLCASMVHRDEMLGVLEFVNKRKGEFDDQDLKLLEAVASSAAVALKNARLSGDLKRLLREREETQARMIHTEKMSALGRLMASIAHEINNPLQAVDGYLSLAAEKLDDPGRVDTLRRYLSIVGEEVDRITDIVNRTRDFYRPEREGFWTVDVDSVIEKVLMLTHKKLEHSNVTVEHTASEELPTIEANAGQLKQVFLNLTINAVEAMPEGGTLYIRTALEHEAGMARIEFEDTGVGMSQEMIKQVFEPFVTTKEEGTGLGMSISYGIVQAHHGEITVASEQGEGTTFTIRLPLEQPEA